MDHPISYDQRRSEQPSGLFRALTQRSALFAGKTRRGFREASPGAFGFGERWERHWL